MCGLARGGRRPSSRWVASRAELWGGRGASAPLAPVGKIAVAKCQRGTGAAVCGPGSRRGQPGGPGLGGPTAGGAASAEPTLPVVSTPSCSAAAKSTAGLHPVRGLPSLWHAGLVLSGGATLLGQQLFWKFQCLSTSAEIASEGGLEQCSWEEEKGPEGCSWCLPAFP